MNDAAEGASLKKGLTLRAAVSGDLEQLLDMLQRFYAEDRIVLDAARVRRGIDQALSDPELGAILLAEHQGQCVGYLLMGWCFSIEQGGRHVLIDELYLAPAARGQGLGEALLAEACEWARGRGAEVVRLEVNRHNPRAKALYLRAGFRDDERDILTRVLEPVGP